MRMSDLLRRLMEEVKDPAGGGGGDPPPADPPAPPAGDPPAPPPDTAAAAKVANDAAAAAKAAEEGYWPADWRNKIAAGDEKLTQRLSRYSSPKDVAAALLSVQNRIGAGELRSKLKDGATAEELAAWRTENGIPDTPDKYELKLDKGLVVGTDDKPLIDSLLKQVHGANGNSQVASAVVNFYYAQVEAAEAERLSKDQAAAQTASDALHAEWGAEFRPNMNQIEGLLDTMPAGTKDLFKFGRLSDGTPLMAHPETIRWLNNLAREINPVTTVIPNQGANIGAAIDTEIKAIEDKMKSNRKAYNADDKMQERYRQLLDARQRAQQKAA